MPERLLNSATTTTATAITAASSAAGAETLRKRAVMLTLRDDVDDDASLAFLSYVDSEEAQLWSNDVAAAAEAGKEASVAGDGADVNGATVEAAAAADKARDKAPPSASTARDSALGRSRPLPELKPQRGSDDGGVAAQQRPMPGAPLQRSSGGIALRPLPEEPASRSPQGASSMLLLLLLHSGSLALVRCTAPRCTSFAPSSFARCAVPKAGIALPGLGSSTELRRVQKRPPPRDSAASRDSNASDESDQSK